MSGCKLLRIKTFVFSTLCGIFACQSQEATYIKGYPFWKYKWKTGELMATYKGVGGGNEWQYYRYFNSPDTLLNLHTKNKYAAPFEVYRRRFVKDKLSGAFYDYSQIMVNGNHLHFPGIEKEWKRNH